MAKLTDDQIRWILSLDAQGVQSELVSISSRSKELTEDNKQLAAEIKKTTKEMNSASREMESLTKKGKENSDAFKQAKERYDASKTSIENLTSKVQGNNKAIEENARKTSEVIKQMKISDMTMSQLSSRSYELKHQLDNTSKAADPQSYKKLSTELNQVRSRMNDLSTETVKTNDKFGFFKNLLPTLGITAIVSGLGLLWSKITGIRSEFEKYQAILANTFQSQRVANKEFDILTRFAAETPFQLNELTGAYVKLVNYGLRPTRDEMTKYGDLASSVGKGFDQLTEAISDAVTGEYERLKEFGIKASKEGDKVTFTFKEQKTTVDNTASSIKKYIQSLGELEGVKGSMSAIAATMTGATSNFGDAIDRLMNKVGSGGIGKLYVDILRGTTNLIDGLIGKSKTYREDLEDTTSELNRELDVLRNGNFTAEERNRMIRKINTEYKEYLPSLLNENSTLKQIEEYQSKINQHMQARIIYAAYEEDIKKILQEQKNALEHNYEIQQKMTKMDLGQDKTFNDTGFYDAQKQKLQSIKAINDATVKMTGKAADETKTKYDSMAKAIGLSFSKIEEIAKRSGAANKTDIIASATSQKKEIDQALEVLETKHQERTVEIKRAYASGEIESESEYNKKIFAEDSAYYILRENALEAFLKKIKDKELRTDLLKKLSDIRNKQVDDELKFRDNIQKIILDANPEEKERIEYENRLRQLGLFGIDRENMTADQLKALELLEQQHNDILFKIRQSGERDRKKQSEEEFEKGFQDRRDQLNREIAEMEKSAEIGSIVGLSGSKQFSAELQLHQSKLQLIREEIQAREKAGLSSEKLKKDEEKQEEALTKTFAREAKRRIDTANQYGQQIGSVLGDILTGQVDAMKGFSNVMLDILFDILTNIVNEKIAEAVAVTVASQAKVVAEAMSQPDSVATFGATGLGRIAVISAVITGALAAAKVALKNLLNKSDSGSSNKSSGFAEGGFNIDSGGYTGPGAKYEIAGILPNGQPFHRGEYFVAQNEMANPVVIQYVRQIESIRRQRTTANSLPGFADGGSTSGLPSLSSGLQSPVSNLSLIAAIDKLNKHLDKGINAKVAGYGGEGSVADAMKQIANLVKNLGL